MSMLAFKGGRAGLRTGPVTFLWWSSNTNDGAFLHSHEHSTPVPWYRALCFSASSQWGHSGVSKQGHLGVSLLKAIAWLFISCFVQKGSHTQYLVHSRLWYLEEVRLLYGVAFLLSPPPQTPSKSFTLCERFHWSCQGFIPFLCPLGGESVETEGGKEKDRYMTRRTCKHSTNPVLLISQIIWPPQRKNIWKE